MSVLVEEFSNSVAFVFQKIKKFVVEVDRKFALSTYMIWKLKAKELSKENSLLAQVIIFFFTLEGIEIVTENKVSNFVQLCMGK